MASPEQIAFFIILAMASLMALGYQVRDFRGDKVVSCSDEGCKFGKDGICTKRNIELQFVKARGFQHLQCASFEAKESDSGETIDFTIYNNKGEVKQLGHELRKSTRKPERGR